MNPVNRLLIIDDDHGLVNLLKRFLEGEGFHVDAAYDQAIGIERRPVQRSRVDHPRCDAAGRHGI